MKQNSIPKHIGIILDGNGRWAKKRHMPRLYGHKKGAIAVKKTISEANKLGVKAVSLYAFSTENWKRSRQEVDGIFEIINSFLKENEQAFINGNYRLQIMGQTQKLPSQLQLALQALQEKTVCNTGLIVNIALSYGGRAEIVEAVNQILKQGKREISQADFEAYLPTANLPALDFVIRTGGEKRISNFMLWEIAYSELYFPKFYWPSFNGKKLRKCIKEFQKRERRFGDVKQ